MEGAFIFCTTTTCAQIQKKMWSLKFSTSHHQSSWSQRFIQSYIYCNRCWQNFYRIIFIDNKKALRGKHCNLFFFWWVSLKRVGHEASIWSLGDKGMPWSHNLKAQKAESTEQCSSIISVLVETNEHMINLKLFFSKLQKNCKTVRQTQGVECTQASTSLRCKQQGPAKPSSLIVSRSESHGLKSDTSRKHQAKV